MTDEKASDLLGDSVGRWSESGLRDVEFQDDFVCTYFGKVGTHSASAGVLDSQGDSVRQLGVVVRG